MYNIQLLTSKRHMTLHIETCFSIIKLDGEYCCECKDALMFMCVYCCK
jgi:hypothetical protein